MDADICEAPQFISPFNPLGDDLHAQLATHLNNAATDGPARLVMVDVSDQTHIELDQVRLKIRQKSQPGITGSEIVDRNDESALPIVSQYGAQVREIGDLLTLGDLEYDAVDRKVVRLRRFQRRPYAQFGR